MDFMKPFPGTYAVVLQSEQRVRVKIGRWGYLTVQPGYYIYIGSAFGPGGVRARVSRHCREAKPRHWHIDYLRAYTEPVAVWCSYDPVHLEHRWAMGLECFAAVTPLKGFGCTDCQCTAHLFYTSEKPELSTFSEALGGAIESCRIAQSD